MDLKESLDSLGHGRKIFGGEHDAYRRSLRQFFRTQIEPNIRQWERDGFFPRGIFNKAGDAGLLGAAIPEKYGGAGGDFLHMAILFEEHGYSTAGAALEAGLTSDVAGLAILDSGTEAQKHALLPKLTTGEAVLDLALTEPHSGSDPRSMKTRARRDGDGYLLNGAKMWISNAPILDVLMVVARMEDGEGQKNRYSTFLMDSKTPGVTISKPTELMMRSAGGVCEIFFEDARIPADAVLGGVEGRGLSSGLNSITQTRLATGARMLAACELAFALTVDFVKNRTAFGQRVIDFQNTQFKLAQIKTEIAVGRGFLDDLLARAAHGEELPVESSMAKLWLSELEGRVMDECVQLHGGAGFSNEYPISKMYAFARVHRIYLGTSEIQRLTIARSIF